MTMAYGPYRWDPDEIKGWYANQAIAIRRRATIVIVSLSFLLLTLLVPLAYGWWLVLALAAALLIDYAMRSPLRKRAKYERLRAVWQALLTASSPEAAMSTQASLDEGERVVYARQSVRYLEGRLQNGAIGLATFDSGDLIVTDQRVLFLGGRNTLSVQIRDMLRYPPALAGNRVTFEYPGRPTGESFAINPELFGLCMARRGGFTAYAVSPPAPLPISDEAHEEGG